MNDTTRTCSRRTFVKAAGIGASAAALGTLALAADVAHADEAASSASDAATSTEPAAAPEAGSEAYAGDTIYIVDVIHCKPGDGQAMYEHYMNDYVPGALERGMTLVHDNVNPPIWLTDDVATNTLEFVWSVPGMMGWATMVGASRSLEGVGPELIEFWRGVDERVESRTRTLSAPGSQVESLTTLAHLGA